MARVHITLVGGQPAPVYNGIIATKPDVVAYIYSNDSLPALNRLREEISIAEDVQKPLDPTNPQKILERANKLAEKYKNDEVTLNISSGLKSWSHLFGMVFEKQPNAAVVYMDQNNVLWNYKTMQGQNDFYFDMFKLFKLYGNPIEDNFTHFQDYTKDDINVCTKIENLRSGAMIVEFNNILSLLDKKNQNILKTNQKGKFGSKTSNSWVEWNKKCDNGNASVHIFLDNGKFTKDLTVESPHAVQIAFNSGWFEYKVAQIISGWKMAKEIIMNCHFPFKKNVDKNEVDIIVNTGPKLLFVECKTQINNNTDIDKFNSVVKAYGGMATKALFVTDAPMLDIAKSKCQNYGINTFSLQENHLGMKNEDALALLLDNELFNINSK